MRRHRGLAGAALSMLFVFACASGQPAPTAVASQPAHALAGGCAGTRVSTATPPSWAQGGWNQTGGRPWPVPWAVGTGDSAVAYLFAVELVAGSSPRKDGTNNKILWVVRNAPAGFVVEGAPFGQSRPLITVDGGPSIIDAQAAGCWSFRLSDRASGSLISTIDLEVLPAGTLPPGAAT